MLKYYKDLDNYEITVKNNELQKKIYSKVPISVYQKYSNIFYELKFIDKLVLSFNSNLFYENLTWNFHSYEDWKRIGEFNSLLEYMYEDNINNFDDNAGNQIYEIDKYITLINNLIVLYPIFNKRLNYIKDNLELLKKELNNYVFYEPKEEYKTLKFGDGFFITPNGYIYNSGGYNGHKENNFINDYLEIQNALENNYNIDCKNILDNLCHKQKEVIDKGYVDGNHFDFAWLNLYDKPPTIYTREIEKAKKLEYAMLHNKMTLFKNKILLDTERSYQTKLFNLLKGFYDAKINFYYFFNNYFQDNTKEKYTQIRNIIGNIDLYDEIVELLVRCMNFHKIESKINKTITTTSLYPVSDFYNYLINDYNIVVIPKIVNNNGKFQEIDLNKLFPASSYKQIEKFELEHSNHGKILIKR